MFLSLLYLQEISFVAQKYSEFNFSLLKREKGYHSSMFLFEINWQFLPTKERFMFGFCVSVFGISFTRFIARGFLIGRWVRFKSLLSLEMIFLFIVLLLRRWASA